MSTVHILELALPLLVGATVLPLLVLWVVEKQVWLWVLVWLWRVGR